MCGKTFGAHPDALLLLQRREAQVRTATFIADCMLADDKPMRPVKAPGAAPKRKLPTEICCAMCNTLKPRKTAFPRASMVCHECQPKARAETRRRYWDKFKAEVAASLPRRFALRVDSTSRATYFGGTCARMESTESINPTYADPVRRAMTASNLDLKILVVLTVATILAMVWVVIKGMDE